MDLKILWTYLRTNCKIMDKGHSRLSIDLFETDMVFMVSETFAVWMYGGEQKRRLTYGVMLLVKNCIMQPAANQWRAMGTIFGDLEPCRGDHRAM